jgi:AraC family transcriptional regulator of adaptative response / methylphosphotriester-DNA alkyltransferase methyltransferase
MPLPKKLISRKEEITADFLNLIEKYFDDLINNRADKMFHTKHFAELLFIHPVLLTNTIKLMTGKSPCEFLENRILSEAQWLLKDTDLPIKEIGYKFLYNDPTNFTKFFKNMSGITPLQYRRNNQLKVA